MRKFNRFMAAAVTVTALCGASALGGVVFQDNFEAHTIGNTVSATPQIGTSWTEGAGSGLHGADIVGSPAFGLNSVRLTRESAPPLGPSNANLVGLSLAGALVSGNDVEVKWKVNVENVHRFNGPMQVSLGLQGALFGSKQMAFIQISDTNADPLGAGGAYAYYAGPGHFSGGLHIRSNDNPANPTVRSSVNTPGANEGRWDTIRAVLHIGTGANGTMDLFVDSADDLIGEVQIAAGSPLEAIDPTGVSDPTKLQIAFVKGPSSGFTFIDDISVNVTAVPEPTTLGVAGAACGLLFRRSRK